MSALMKIKLSAEENNVQKNNRLTSRTRGKYFALLKLQGLCLQNFKQPFMEVIEFRNYTWH